MIPFTCNFCTIVCTHSLLLSLLTLPSSSSASNITLPSSFIATGYSLLLLPSSSLSYSQPLICVPMSFPLYCMTWHFFITMPFPLEYSYLYTKRVQSWGHLFCCHFCMDATWNLPGNSMLSHESPPLLWLFDRKEWVGYVFGDTTMSNFTSRTFDTIHNGFFNLACFQHKKQSVSSEKAPIHPLHTLTS